MASCDSETRESTTLVSSCPQNGHRIPSPPRHHIWATNEPSTQDMGLQRGNARLSGFLRERWEEGTNGAPRHAARRSAAGLACGNYLLAYERSGASSSGTRRVV